MILKSIDWSETGKSYNLVNSLFVNFELRRGSESKHNFLFIAFFIYQDCLYINYQRRNHD